MVGEPFLRSREERRRDIGEHIRRAIGWHHRQDGRSGAARPSADLQDSQRPIRRNGFGDRPDHIAGDSIVEGRQRRLLVEPLDDFAAAVLESQIQRVTATGQDIHQVQAEPAVEHGRRGVVRMLPKDLGQHRFGSGGFDDAPGSRAGRGHQSMLPRDADEHVNQLRVLWEHAGFHQVDRSELGAVAEQRPKRRHCTARRQPTDQRQDRTNLRAFRGPQLGDRLLGTGQDLGRLRECARLDLLSVARCGQRHRDEFGGTTVGNRADPPYPALAHFHGHLAGFVGDEDVPAHLARNS